MINASESTIMKNFIIFVRRLCSWLVLEKGGLRLVVILFISGLFLPACSQAEEVGDNFLHPPTKAPTATLHPPKMIDIGAKLDAQGRALDLLSLEAPDGCMRMEIDRGTKILNAAGQPASRLVIQQNYPGKLPMQAYGVSISYAYHFSPDELKFSAPVKIVFTCLTNFKKTLLTEISLGMQSDDGQWDQISVQGDDYQVWTRLESLKPGWGYLLVGPAPMGS
jgi:hypothetical protein